MTSREQPRGESPGDPLNTPLARPAPENEAAQIQRLNQSRDYSFNWLGDRYSLNVTGGDVRLQRVGSDSIDLKFPERDHSEATIKGVENRIVGSIRAYSDRSVVLELLAKDPNITVFATFTHHSDPQVNAYPDPERKASISENSLQAAAKQFKLFGR